MSKLPNILNSFWSWREVYAKLGIFNPAYKYWKNTPNLKLNNKYVFIQKQTLPNKREYAEDVKFVNIKSFFREYGINVNKNSIGQLGKIKDLKNDYGLVVYG